MSLEDFSRLSQGKRPKDRSWWDRFWNSDEDGCLYDQAIAFHPVSLGLMLALFGGLLLVGWASGDPMWEELLSRLRYLYEGAKWLMTP